MRAATVLLLGAVSAFAQDPVERGARVFRQAGCIACHVVNGRGGPTGPDLSKIGASRTDTAWLRKFVRDPAALIPGSRMPPFEDLTEAELAALTAYLLGLK